MFRSDWAAGYTIAGLVLAAFFGAVFIDYVSYGSSNQKTGNSAQQCAKENAQNIPKLHPFCGTVVDESGQPFSGNKSACKKEQSKFDPSPWCDLAAQQSMADATVGMERATWAAVWASIIAVILIALTFVQTRRAAVATGSILEETEKARKAAENSVSTTRDVGQAQVRAHLTPENVQIVLGENIRPVLFFHINNSGNSPASEIQVSNSVQFSVQKLIKKPYSIPSISAPLNTLAPKQKTSEIKFDCILGGGSNFIEDLKIWRQADELNVNVRVSISFRDVFKEVVSEKFDFATSIKKPDRSKRVQLPPDHEFRLDESMTGIPADMQPKT